MRRSLLSLAVLLAACTPDAVTRPPPISAPNAAVGQDLRPYIVVLEPGANPDVVAATVGASPRYVYYSALNGFAASLPDAAVEALQRNPNVDYVEPDGVARLVADSPWNKDPTSRPPATLAKHVPVVVSLSSDKEMIRVAASGIVASMKDVLPSGDRSIRSLPRHAMGQREPESAMTALNHAVSGWVFSAGPKPTSGDRSSVNLLPKPVFETASRPALLATGIGATRRTMGSSYTIRFGVEGRTANRANNVRHATNIQAFAENFQQNPTSITPQALPSSWGLDRIDQHNVDLNSQYNPPNDGAGVHVYLLDTGIWTQHIDFGGRAIWGPDFTGHYLSYDCNGHGTHVAGTIGGAYYGVAKAVQLVSVRVFGCIGSTEFSTIIAAVDWVTANAARPAVVNMSLGGPLTQSLNDAVSNSIASGIVYAVAAGNDNTDACNTSPASTPTALTVGSIALDDRRSEFSNQGPCVDVFAPGSEIFSDWTGQDQWYTYLCGNSCVHELSGTSMASPHVAGVAAQLLSHNPTATPAQVHAAIVGQCTTGTLWYNLSPGTPSCVLYATQDLIGGSSPPPEQTPPPPTMSAAFTASCAGFLCTFTPVSSGGWDFNDGATAVDAVPPAPISHTFAPRRKYTVMHGVGTDFAYRVVNCTPKKCQAQ